MLKVSSVPKYKINLPLTVFSVFGRCSLYFIFVFVSLLIYEKNASSQGVVYGAGPSVNNVPGFSTSTGVQLGDPVSCPTPSFNLSAFGGSGNDWANNFEPYASSYTGANNYGLAVGFSIPIGGSMGKFCEEFARKRIAFEGSRSENQIRNSQLSLLQQCYWLQTSGFLNERNKEIFSNNENFSSLLPCFEVDLDRSGASITNPIQEKPPKSDTESSSPPTTIIQDQRRF